MCYLKGLVSVYISDAQLGLWVSLEHAFSCVFQRNTQTTKMSNAQALPTS